MSSLKNLPKSGINTKALIGLIGFPHSFGSAYTSGTIRRLWPDKVTEADIISILNSQENKKNIYRSGRYYFKDSSRSTIVSHFKRIFLSHAIFRQGKLILQIATHCPWVRFIGITGANSFESCKEDDDLDLFIVTKVNRLWLTHLAFTLANRLVGRRLFCANYYLEEDDLKIKRNDRYVAIQLLETIPVYDPDFLRRILKKNPWVKKLLPNSSMKVTRNGFYELRPLPVVRFIFTVADIVASPFLYFFNYLTLNLYRWTKKRKLKPWPRDLIIELHRASLHLQDRSKMYEFMYSEINGNLKSSGKSDRLKGK